MISTIFDRLTALALGKPTVEERRRRVADAMQQLETTAAECHQRLAENEIRFHRAEAQYDFLKHERDSRRQALHKLRQKLTTAGSDSALRTEYLLARHEFHEAAQASEKHGRRLRHQKRLHRRAENLLRRRHLRISRHLTDVSARLDKDSGTAGILKKAFTSVAWLILLNQIGRKLFERRDSV